MDSMVLAHGTALLIAAVAAVTDFRRGEIPNWLTLPPLLVAPLVHAIAGGRWAALGSLAGIAACGLAPYLLFRRGAAGGGDVKLFAAIGAVAGVSVGLEAELISLAAAALVSLGRLAWRGRLLQALSSSLFLGINPLLPRRWRRTVSPELMTAVRLGGFAFAGTSLVLALRHPMTWA